ncbi:MAG: amino acid permease [Lewinellaceae bacterium]|nr:amino acid permease [Saprospiraceae bacterium]MCB9336802.1 amino acid permease [Lewinellaceae bacterium]
MAHLQKKLTLYGLTMIAVGSCIGSGIFITPAQIVSAVPNATLVLAVWALGGVIALTGALTFSELGGLFPQSGGVYVYIKSAYGNLAGFLYGWVILLVINTGALAGLCVAFAEYMKIFAPDMGEHTKIAIAAATMLSLTCFNILGVSISQGLANFFTGLKLLSIGCIIAAAFIYFDPAKVNPDFSLAQNVPDNLATAMLTGLIGVLFSVGGWHHASYVAGEAMDAPRTVPRAMFFGVLIVMVTYLLVNLAYMLLLPLDAIANTPRVAGDAVSTLAPWGGRAVAVAIALSIFGTISIYTMSAPRIYFAMAEDGIFFKQLAYVHPRWKTPVVAMLVQVVWALAVLLFFRGLFNEIITFVTFMDIAFMGLAGAAVFIFRKKMKSAQRPVRAWGYPWVPLIFVVISAAFAINTFFERPAQALPGLGLLGLGVLVFYGIKYWRQMNRKA